MIRRTSRFAVAALFVAIPAIARAQAPEQAPASAPASAPAQPSSFESKGTVVTVRSDTGRVKLEVRHGQTRVIGYYDPAEIELWTVAASRLFDVVDATALGTKEGGAPRIVETRTPQLLAADTGALVLDRVFTYSNESMNIYISDRGSAHSLYYSLADDTVRDLLEAMRRAAGEAHELAAASVSRRATHLAGN